MSVKTLRSAHYVRNAKNVRSIVTGQSPKTHRNADTGQSPKTRRNAETGQSLKTRRSGDSPLERPKRPRAQAKSEKLPDARPPVPLRPAERAGGANGSQTSTARARRI